MTQPWPLVALAEVLTPVNRPEPVKPETTYSILGAHWYAGGLYTKEIATGAGIRASNLYRVEQGDFVYNRLFAWKGSFAVATAENAGCYVSNEFPSFRPHPDYLDAKFLWRYFSRSSTWDDALALSTGGTPTSRNRLKEDKLLAFRIPLPPLDEQRRIVARIETLAAKVEEARHLRVQATECMKGFVASLHVKMAGARVRRLEQFLELYEDQEAVRIGRGYPQVGVKGFGQGLFERPPIEATQTTYAAFNRLYAGAVVLSQVKGWEGAIAVCPSELTGRYASPEYRTFRCISGEAAPEYLAALFASPWFWSRLSDLTRGVGARRERVRPELFLRMEIPMPCIQDQRRALPLLDNLRTVANYQAETAAELDALLPAILDRAFRGEL